MVVVVVLVAVVVVVVVAAVGAADLGGHVHIVDLVVSATATVVAAVARYHQ